MLKTKEKSSSWRTSTTDDENEIQISCVSVLYPRWPARRLRGQKNAPHSCCDDVGKKSGEICYNRDISCTGPKRSTLILSQLKRHKDDDRQRPHLTRSDVYRVCHGLLSCSQSRRSIRQLSLHWKSHEQNQEPCIRFHQHIIADRNWELLDRWGLKLVGP